VPFPYSGGLSPTPAWVKGAQWNNLGQNRNGVFYAGDTVELFFPQDLPDSAVRTYGFDRGVAGAALTTSLYAADWTPPTTPNTMIHDDTHVYEGGLSGYTNGASDAFYWQFPTTPRTEHYGRFYFYTETGTYVNNEAGSRGSRLMQTLHSGSGNILWLNASRKISWWPKAGSIPAGTVTVPWDQWVRIEYHIVHSATVGSLEARLYLDPTSSTPDEVVSGSGVDTAVDMQLSYHHVYAGLWIDDVVANHTTWVGTTNPEVVWPTERDYLIRDYYGDVVSSGSFTGVHFTPDAPVGGWKPGWYRVYLTGPNFDSLFNYSYGATNFCVIRDDPHFVAMPAATTSGGGNSEGPDYVMKGVMGMGTSRLIIGNIDNLSASTDTLARAQSDAAISATYYSNPGAPYADGERTPRALWCTFPNGSIDGNSLPCSGCNPAIDNWARTTVKDETVDGAQVFLTLTPGSVSGSKVEVYYPDASTLVETYDNLASNTAAQTAIDGVSNYIRFFKGTGLTPGTQATPTAIGRGRRDNLVTVVSTLYPLGVTHYEGPQNEGKPDAFLAHTMRLFQAYVHEGHPDAVAMGPSSVNIYTDFLAPFFDAGGGDYCDEFAFHAYNSAPNGNLNTGRTIWQALLDYLDGLGYGSKQIWQTESTHALTNYYGSTQYRRAVRTQLMYQLLLEQYGVPREYNSPWYDVSHGFWTYMSWLEQGDTSLFPQCVASRVLAEETWGKPYSHALDMGERGDSIYLGSVYTAADTSGCVVLMPTSYIDNASVTLTITGTSSPLTVVDGFGNETSVAQVSGRVTVTPTELPTYVRLPVGVTATVYQCHDWGPNPTASIASTATTKTLGGVSKPAIANDGFLLKYTGASDAADVASSTGPTPETAELLWASPVTVGRVIVWAGMAWQAHATLIDFDVETYDGAVWTTQATVTKTDPADVTYWHGQDGMYESYWDQQWVFDVPFPASVECEGVRLNVRQASWGGEPHDFVDLLGYSIGVGVNSPDPQHVTIQEIGVYAEPAQASTDIVFSATTNGTAPAQPMPVGVFDITSPSLTALAISTQFGGTIAAGSYGLGDYGLGLYGTGNDPGETKPGVLDPTTILPAYATATTLTGYDTPTPENL